MDYWARNTAATLLLATALLQACKPAQEKETLPYYNTANFTPLFFSREEAEEHMQHQVRGILGTDQNDQAVNDNTVVGKIHVANFFFASCGSICPTMQEHLSEVVQAFAKTEDVVFLSFSVTPEKDSVPVLQHYAAHHGYTSPQWHFITGSREDIYTLARTAYFADASTGMRVREADVLHTEHVLLVDDSGFIRGIYNGTLETEIGQLRKDIETLLKVSDPS